METLMLPNSSWLMQPGRRTRWTKEENKLFESALAMIDERTPDRWVRVAHMVPGKSVSDVINRFQELAADVSNIEAGLVPVPGYLASSFPVELVDDRGFPGFRKRGRGCDQERKKGVPWTEEEHRRFLMGLDKYGKGDWRNISRNYVISKTPTQVASHAQKYFLRQLSGSKDKRRPSIHDITTFNLADPNPSEAAKKSVSDEKSIRGTLVPKTIAGTPELESWNFPDDGADAVAASMFRVPADSSFVAYPSQVGYAKFGLEINPTRYQTLRG
nr:transcription factor DIVARICATA-like [Ipomoea batatas]